MAVRGIKTGGDELTHTERIAREEPEAVKAVAERSRRNGRTELANYLLRVLSNVDN